MFGDQFYWASRVRAEGLGASVANPLTTESVAVALREAFEPAVAARAAAFARRLPLDGAMVAARRIAG